MKNKMEIRLLSAIATLWLSMGLVPFASIGASAEDVADFYRGKTINIVIGYSPGGGYDVFARLLAQHLGRHIPGDPIVVPQNMPGAGSRKATLYLYNVAPKDGTFIGTVGRNEAVAPLIEDDANFDGTKFGWIGSVANDNSVCISWHTSSIRTWQDLMSKTLTVGALAPGDNTVTVPLALENIFKAHINMVKGYPGTSDLFLALERGEVEGACGVSWRPIAIQHPDWISDKKVNVLVEVALSHDPSLVGTPIITDFVTDPEQTRVLSLLIATQAMARPFMAPPDIPEDRKQALRTAFDETMTDPAFLADVKKSKLYTQPLSGDGIDKLLANLYAVPADVRAKAARAIQEAN